MQLGIEVLLERSEWLNRLKGQRVALLGHPSSTNQKLQHTLELLMGHPEIELSCAFGPQHGMMGDKQYNMEESPTYEDQETGLRIHSLYGDVRRPTDAMMDEFDIVLVDLQDVGCRIYTYVATTIYMMEACAKKGKSIWILDRPNPVGRTMDGSFLSPEWMSFVGEVPTIMQHGLTLGELAQWYCDKEDLNLDLQVVPMEDYNPEQAPGFGWPEPMPWVNPSPQLPNLESCRVYNGTVLLEATHLSEGRGTTIPLQVFGAPQLNANRLIKDLNENYAEWLGGSILRKCFFVPFFNKYEGQLCEGVQIHTDVSSYNHKEFRPYRLMAGIFKSLLSRDEGFDLWNDFHYEYEQDRSPTHLLTGSTFFKDWVDDPSSSVSDFNGYMDRDIKAWDEVRRSYMIY
ncbi:MAG: hypothetical protein CL677_03845 [Bdellovibrionaceae bacterium]|nr:hypothetical protein [Pseudobdellovibrionaceae bacterium]